MKFWQAFLELLFPTPRICPFCHRQQPVLQVCTTCEQELTKFRRQWGQCARCGTFGMRGTECLNCSHWPKYYLKNYALIPYQDQWRQVIFDLKFRKQGWLAQPLAQLMALALMEQYFDLIVPIPLHITRLRSRGFNQASLLASEIAKIKDIPLEENILTRTHSTAFQSGLNKTQRARNVQQAFLVENQSLIKGKRVLLVDDLLTSGATLQESAKMLYQAGARTIISITLSAGIK